MSGITVIVGGTDLTEIACNTLSFTKAFEVGDKSASWTMPFPKYVIPADYATTFLYDTDSGAEIWRGRFRWELPEWDSCVGMTDCTPEGLAMSLTDEVFHESIVYGPQIKKKAAPPEFPADTLLGTVIALNIGQAVTHAVTQLCPSVSLGTVDGASIALEERSRDFFHQNAQSVIKYMSGLSAYLSTPFVQKVHNGTFTWTTTPGGVRYTVTLGDAVKMGVRRSPENIANRVGVGYGRHQGVTSPLVVDTTLVGGGIIRDKAVDVSGQITQIGIAQQVADGVYGRGLELQNGWSYTVTIGRTAQVYDNSLGVYIHPLLMEPGEWLQVNGIDNASFTKHPPATHFITEISCDKNLTVRATCGETRSMEDAAAMRWQISQAEPLKDATSTTFFPPSAGLDPKVPWTGPKYNNNTDLRLETGPVTTVQQPPPHAPAEPGDPRGVDYPYSSSQKLLPQNEPGQPPAISLSIPGADLKALGVKMTVNVPPVKLIAWSVDCSDATTFTLKLYTQSGNTQIGPAMSLATGTAKSAGTYTYYTSGYTALAIPLDVPFFDRWAVVVDAVAPDTLPDDAWGILHLHLVRLFPQYPDVARDVTDPEDFIIDVPYGIGKNAA